MSEIMTEVINDSLSIWNQCINTSFVKELTNGTLSEKKLLKYLIEDTLYLKEYARCFAYAMTKAKTLEEMKVFYSVLSFVNESETSLRKKYLIKYNLTDNDVEKMKPSEDNQAYISHMLQYAINGNTKEILMAILPCMLSYHYIFCEALNNNSQMLQTTYGDLLRGYTSDSYRDSCLFWTNYTNQLCQNITEEEKSYLLEIFRKSSEYELLFWQMSYDT